MNLKTALWNWLQFGTEGHDTKNKRRLIVINVLITIPPLVTIPYVLLMLLADPTQLWYPALSIYFVSLFFLATPFFHPYSLYAGAIYNLTLWCFFGLMASYILTRESGVHYFFLTGAVSAMAILGVKLNILSLVSILYGLIAFVVVESGGFPTNESLTYAPWVMQTFFYVSIAQAFTGIFCVVYYAFFQVHRAEELLEQEYAYSERLLSSMMPVPIAQQLKREPHKTIADSHSEVTILFADIVGFTPLFSDQSPTETVEFLSRIFTEFDELAKAHGVERIKTIGDGYMAAGGVPIAQEDHAERVLALAHDMIAFVERISASRPKPIELRIGLHSGPVTAGVIGTQKPFYDVWGDTVNLAARMESHGEPGQVHVSDQTRSLLGGKFTYAPRGKVDVKGVGPMETYFVTCGAAKAAQ